MTTELRIDTDDVDAHNIQRPGGVGERVTYLYENDRQFRAASPRLDVLDAARKPGLRLSQVLRTLAEGYSDRPAVGTRAVQTIGDELTGRCATQLLPAFNTISYGELWSRVQAVANAWHHDTQAPVEAGDFVATIGFSSADYLTIDLVCGYLGLVAVPLQHNTSASRLVPILEESAPRVLAVSADYLDLAVEAALGSGWLSRLVVFDYRPQDDNHRDRVQHARDSLAGAGMEVIVETLPDIIARGTRAPEAPLFTDGSDDRLAMILYTSGSTGAPKGAMWTERMVRTLWTIPMKSTESVVINLNFMPLNHLGGRLPLAASFQTGGTSYFVAESDLSTLFDDWMLVRPTDLGLVPRVVDMLYQRYQQIVDRLSADGLDLDTAERTAKTEIRETLLGGRVLGGFVSTAPLSAEMRLFLESCLQADIVDTYGLTEIGAVTTDGLVVRPLVLDYKLVDVPELGYFSTDKPHPRGELLVKSAAAMPGYYKRPEITAEVFDADGYYRTGDIVAELEPDRLAYVDRRNNVIKLSQGEFVAVANLEAEFARTPLIRQIYVYGNSERSSLLAVVVPTEEALAVHGGVNDQLRAAVRAAMSQTARDAGLQPYEVPVDFLIETEPFSVADGLLSGVGKLLRPKLKERYGAELEALYDQVDAARADDVRALRDAAQHQPVVDTVIQAAAALLGIPSASVTRDDHFIDLGGDSLSALTFSNLLQELFGIETPVGTLTGPTTTLGDVASHLEQGAGDGVARPTATSVHHSDTTIHAADLTLDKFLPANLLDDARALPLPVDAEPHTVLLTGANGYLGRFLALEWLQRLAQTGGTLICLLRGSDNESARMRLEQIFDDGDAQMSERFHDLAAEHLEVIAGDISQPQLGVDPQTWDALTQRVDLIVHPAALVNHVLPYRQLFGPNVVGTAEVIALALSSRLKPINYLSTVSVAMTVEPERFEEDGDIRTISPTRPIDDSYANGYGNSKWAGEVLLRQAHDLCGLPVSVFRSGMILADRRYDGQLNVSDMFTRLIYSLVRTGLAPESFYQRSESGERTRSHYDGLPVDFVAESITTLGAGARRGFRSYDVMNPHDDGISLDVFVDWLIETGHSITRVDDYDDWLSQFDSALRALPDAQRQQSVLPLLTAYSRPERPLLGSLAPAQVFRKAVQENRIGADQDIPHLSRQLIEKYVSGLRGQDLLPN
ncbi:thioester reductase domain protein [Mycolicibacterium rhodesiae JS60]|nr:thioester reductase domain protein [Mycolicibacterium rhodesiae JS60]